MGGVGEHPEYQECASGDGHPLRTPPHPDPLMPSADADMRRQGERGCGAAGSNLCGQ
jgi:hypothetical protein